MQLPPSPSHPSRLQSNHQHHHHHHHHTNNHSSPSHDKLAGDIVHTYRSFSKENLRLLPAPDALEELVDYVLGNVDLHGRHRRRRRIAGSQVVVRGSSQGNASGSKHCSRHGEYAVCLLAQKQAARGVKLAPGCCQGEQCMERAPRHWSEEQAVQAGCKSTERPVSSEASGVCWRW